jgi:acetyltransferase-like isoleucine patch superfamily enzyme
MFRMDEVTAAAGPLPRSVGYYVRSPGPTLRKVSEWAAARFWLRSCTAVGAWTRLTGKIFIDNRGTIRIGERVQLHSHYAQSILTAFPGGVLEIGDRTIVNYGADICATKLVQIGADCMLGTHVIILDSDFHTAADHQRVPVSRPVVIQDGAWIGNRAMILPGVTIGEGAVVGAGSVVMSDVPARSIAMGNPARVIKKL